MLKRLCIVLLALLGWLSPTSGPAHGGGNPSGGALAPATSGGLQAVERALVRLSGHRRVLMIGAHPDDEDNALLTYVSRALGGEAAYLSLSRGEGGQNLIGPELGRELGVLRTGELLAARELEDTRQYFARAYDFGYTRSLEETFSRWPRRTLQQDAVRAARRFKPQVVVAVFPASGRAGHGQHQASAVIAQDVFDLAGEATALPELAAEGLAPWTPEVLYRRGWGAEEGSFAYSLAGIDTLSGRSFAQMAAASRSLHRSQDMGRTQPIGRFEGRLVWVAGGVGNGAEAIFDGIDTRLAAIAAPIESEALRRRLEQTLRKVEGLAVEARQTLTPADLGRVVEPFVSIVRLLGEAAAVAQDSGSQVVIELVAEKRAVAQQGLAAAAGIFIDARSDRSTVVIGESVLVDAELWTPTFDDVAVRGVGLSSSAGWTVDPAVVSETWDEETRVRRWTMEATAPRDNVDAWGRLVEPGTGDLYDWRDIATSTRGEPFAPPPLVVTFDLQVAGVEVTLEREVVHRFSDQAFGEMRLPLRAVEPVEVELTPGFVFWRRGETAAIELEAVVRSNIDKPVNGRLVVEAPAGWEVTGGGTLRIEGKVGSVARSLRISPIATPSPGRETFSVTVELEDGYRAAGSVEVLEYPHVRPRPIHRGARVTMSIFDLALPALERVGYVVGASDRVPAVLESLGLPITLLSGDDLSVGDLGRFDVIVIGSRAYEIDEGLRSSNSRLLDYVRDGGTVVVQYQQYQFVEGRYAPLLLEIARPHGRVTDETAAVTVLDSEHPVFWRPNRIDETDWDGWVQERGLYFAAAWDPAYVPVLVMRDPGHEQERGSLLIARHGNGTYVYTGLSFFRQLPAGVAGAVRLFVNLLGAGR